MANELARYQNRLTDFEQAQVTKLTKILNKHMENELLAYWDIGTIICNVYKQAEKFIEKYGREAAEAAGMLGPRRVELIAETLGINPKTLIDSMRVVERWETKERFVQMFLSHKDEDKKLLTFAHVKELSRFNDDNVVAKHVKEVIDKNMTVRELQLNLRKLAGKGKKRGPGRAPKAPTNVETCLSLMQNVLEALMRKIDTVWFGKEFNLLDALNEIPAEFWLENGRLYDKLTDTLEVMNAAAHALNDCVARVQAYIDEVAYVFDPDYGKEKESEIDTDRIEAVDAEIVAPEPESEDSEEETDESEEEESDL